MRKMSLARQIRVQKLQDKNRMVGETFNPSGITSEQIQTREQVFINEWKNKTISERRTYWANMQEMDKVWVGSWPWEWCAFSRAFVRSISGPVLI